MGIVGFAPEFRKSRDDNIFYKLLRKKEVVNNKLTDVVRPGVKIFINNQKVYYRSYSLDAEENELFMKYYNIPTMQIENVKQKVVGETIDWDKNVKISLYHESASKYQTKGGVISVMIYKEYEYYLKEEYEMYDFPFDHQDLSIELSIDEGKLQLQQ